MGSTAADRLGRRPSPSAEWLAVVAALSLFLNLLVLVSPLYMSRCSTASAKRSPRDPRGADRGCRVALLVFGVLEVIRHQALIRMSTWLDRRLSEPVLAASVGEALAERAVGAQPLRDVASCAPSSAAKRLPGSRRALDAGFHRGDLDAAPVARRAGIASRGPLVCARAGQRNRHARAAPRGQRALDAAQQSGETALRNAEVVHAMGMLRRSCGAGMPMMIGPSSGTRRQATVAPSWSAAPSSCACSSRSPSSDSAPTWCWIAS